MSEPSCHRQPFRLGSWTVEPVDAILRGPSGSPRIDYKAMHVLCFLADQAGRTVSREAIFDHVWPDTAVTDDVLTVAISTLRRALGDDAREPTFIRTIPKRGYRLLVPPTPLEQPPVPARRVRRNAILGGAVAAILILAAAGIALRGAAERGTDRTIRSIAVLPFKNYSEDPGRQYLADGVTEAITTRLAQTDGLEVTSRTTAGRREEAGHTVTEIGRELDVDAVLEGSIQVSGDQLRLHAQLIDVASDRHLWAEEYDRPLDDLLQVQRDLAHAIAARVAGEPVPRDTVPAVDPRAYDLFLKARYLRHEETPPSLVEALRNLEHAIELSPDFPGAHAALAEVLYLQTELGMIPSAEAFARGAEAAERALGTAPDLPAAHAARAIAAFSLDWDFDAAGRSFERAVSRGDPDLFTLKWYARYLVVTGRAAEAVDVAKTIHEIDPESYVNVSHALALSYAGRHGAALERLRQIESLVPASPATHAAYTQIYLQEGRHDEAARSVLRFAEAAQWPEARLAEIREALEHEGSDAVYRYLAGDGSPLTSMALRAKFHAMLGHAEEALALLEESVDSRDMNVLWINADRSFDALRSSTRFRELVRRLGLAPAHDG